LKVPWRQALAHGRFTRAVATRNLWAAELAIGEMPNGFGSLDDALRYLELLAEQKPERVERAAVRWLGRLCVESQLLTLREVQLALGALANLAVDRELSIALLKRPLRKARPTLTRRIS
jgi:hypothetical protein